MDLVAARWVTATEWAGVEWVMVMAWAPVPAGVPVLDAINHDLRKHLDKREGNVLPFLFSTLKIIPVCFKMVLTRDKRGLVDAEASESSGVEGHEV